MAVKVSKKKPNDSALSLFGINTSDPSRGAANQVNSISDKVNKYSTPLLSGLATGSGLAGWMGAFGGPSQSAPKKASPAAKKVIQPKAQPVQNPASDPSFLDFLAQAQGLVGSGGGTGIDFSGQRQQATQTANDASAKLQAMYNALHNNLAADAPAIAQNFDQGVQSVGDASAAATGDINNAYDAARQAQTAQLAALGIGDAAGVIAGKGTSSANDQARAVSNVAQNQAADQTLLNTSKAGSLDYNGKIANAATQAGTDKAAAIQQALAQKLQDISDQQAQAQAQATSAQGSGTLDLAQTLFNAYLAQTKQSDTNSYNAAKLAQSANGKASALSSNTKATTLASLISTLMKNGQDYNTASANAAAIVNSIK